MCVMEEFNGMMCDVSENDIHIKDSYTMNDENEMFITLSAIKEKYPECKTFNRSWDSMFREWRSHNRLYYWGLFKSHTKDVDLNYPQKCYEKIIYFILGF